MAIWRPDLRGRRGPKYLQIVEAMAEDVSCGRLAAGARLPPHRDLAYQLALSPNTTSRAYAEGVRRALLRGEVGRGTFVRGAPSDPGGASAQDLRRGADGPIDLSRNLPPPGLAEAPLRKALGALGRSGDLSGMFDYQTDADLSRHQAAAAQWLALCGVAADQGDVTVTIGAQHGVYCALAALCRPGDLLVTEALSYGPVFAMAERLGLRLAGAAIDEDGLSPEALDALCAAAAPRMVYLTPTLQTPTTATMPEARRRAIAEIARRRDLLILEDDVFGLLKEDRPPPLARFAPERVIYATSVSKSMAPGLRVGYLRAPRMLAPALRRAVNLTAWMTPPLPSELAVRLIESGAATSLIAAQRRRAEARQRLAASLLGRRALSADPSGTHAWIRLPSGWTADAFREAAAAQGVLVAEARDFAAAPTDCPEAVRICLTHEPEETRVRDGLARLDRLLDLPPMRRPVV